MRKLSELILLLIWANQIKRKEKKGDKIYAKPTNRFFVLPTGAISASSNKI